MKFRKIMERNNFKRKKRIFLFNCETFRVAFWWQELSPAAETAL